MTYFTRSLSSSIVIAFLLSGCTVVDKGYWDGVEGKNIPQSPDFDIHEYLKGYGPGLKRFNNREGYFQDLYYFLEMKYCLLTGQQDKLKTEKFWPPKKQGEGYIEYIDKTGKKQVIEI